MLRNMGRSKTVAYIVGICGLLIVIVALAGSILNRIGITDPRVTVTAKETVGFSNQDKQSAGYRLVEKVVNGEVMQTAYRLQEARQVATATGLLVATELMKRRVPASADNLVNAALQQNLLPKFIKGQQFATLETDHSYIQVRFRKSRVGIEVVSIGKIQNKLRDPGQAILIRVPTNEHINESGVWLLHSLEGITIPPPLCG